jgi:hypothetical protein
MRFIGDCDRGWTAVRALRMRGYRAWTLVPTALTQSQMLLQEGTAMNNECVIEMCG